MSDQGGWASPSGGEQEPEPPRYGERVAGWTPPAQPAPSWAAQAPVAPAAGPAYVPPPKPGLIPLHPLSFGQLLGASFAVIRYNPRATVAPALIVSLIQNVLVLGLTYGLAITTADRLERAATDSDRSAIAVGAIGIGAISTIAVLVVAVIGTALLQGILTRVVADGALGRRPTFGQALRIAWSRILPLIGYALLIGAIQFVLLAIFAAIAVALFIAGAGVAVGLGVSSASSGSGADAAAQVVGAVVVALIIAFIVGAVLGVAYGFVAVKLSLAPSSILLERRGVFASIARSWRMTRGAFWRTLGLLAVVTIMVSIAGQLVSAPFSLIGGALGGLLFPNSQGSFSSGDEIVPLLVSTLPAMIVAVVVAGVGQIAQVSAVVLVYIDRRMRLEGLDLDLQRFVEQGGERDPFEPVE